MSAARAPRVALLHNYREQNQVSMKLYAEQLGAALRARGTAVSDFVPPDALPDSLTRSWLGQKADSYLGRFVSYPRVLGRVDAEVFHVVDHGQAYLLRWLDPARTVVTCHDIILLVLASGRLGARFAPPLATRLLRASVAAMHHAKAIVAVSEQTRADLADLAGIDPARVRVIPNGLNFAYRPATPEERAATRARFGLGEGPLVLQVGQTGFYKNIEGTLQVIARLRAGGLPVTLVRAGHGIKPSQQRLRERLGLGSALRELGPVSAEDLAALYAAVDVLLFPSHYEGFGWPPLEAMASGTAVVCSRGGALREVVGDAALTSDAEDVDGLAEHVAAVLSNPALRAALVERGRARAAQFSWARTAEAIQGVYREVLEG